MDVWCLKLTPLIVGGPAGGVAAPPVLLLDRAPIDVQARGGGGVAERLHTSCRHLVAVAEIEGRECWQDVNTRTPTSVTP
jgi:hypothetical protein